jgi:hypothetical protein
LNKLQIQINKDSRTKHVRNATYVTTHISHDRRDDHRGYRNSRSVSRHHHSPKHSIKISHAESENSPSMSHARDQRRISELNSLQGNIRKLKPPNFDGEHRKGEYLEA